MRLKFPTAPTILMIVAGFVALLTWVVPAGNYDTLAYDAARDTFVRNSLDKSTELPANRQTLARLNIEIPIEKFREGAIYKPIAIPGTYQALNPNPQGFGAFAMAPVKGVIAAADIIFMILVIGGLIGIMNATGAFDVAIGWLAKILQDREYVLIILVTTGIALGGTTFGLSEETMAFYPILIPVFLAARYDAMVGLACIFVGSGVGAMCSTMNPFSTIIASDAAGISWTNGLYGRLLMFLVCTTITVLYILRYARRVKANPSKSLVYEQKESLEALFGLHELDTDLTFSPRLRGIIAVFTACFVVMIAGVSLLDWWFVEMTAVFLVGAILIGWIGRIKEGAFLEAFVSGAADLLGVAFIVGIARGVTLLMEDGLISDTLLYHASTLTTGMDKSVFINAMFLVYGGLSFFISSSSGLAVLTMPIMSPLADTVHIGREMIVNAYQYGNGLFYLINPTGLILAALAIVKIKFNTWLRFIMPLFLLLLVTTMVLLTIFVL